MASCDPIESPSGRECDERTKRCRERMASTICASSGGVVVIGIGGCVGGVDGSFRGANVVQEFLDAVLAGNGFVVEELDLGRPPEAQARADLAPQERRGAPERAIGAAARLVVAEGGVVHARLLEIRRHGHARDRHEPDPRIVHLAREHRRDFASNLVGNASSAWSLSQTRACQVRNSTSVRVINPGSTRSISSATAASSRSACFSSVLTVTTASAARCQRSWCSTSDTATLNFFSRSLIRRSTIRLSFSDWLPGTCSSIDNSAITIEGHHNTKPRNPKPRKRTLW